MTNFLPPFWPGTLPTPIWKVDLAKLAKPMDFSRYFTANFKDIWWTSAPPNIRPLRGEIELFAVYDLIREEGLPLVPVPRSQIVLELMQASDMASRRKVLEERSADVLEDCEAEFERLESSERAGEFAVFALDAVRAFQTGSYRSAQALASAVTTTVLDDLAPSFDEVWRKARNRGGAVEFPEELDEAPPYEFWVLAPLWHAYESAKDGDLVDKWGRHSSIHEASEVHYNVPNAVTSLMFLAALLDFIDSRPRRA